MCQDFCSDTKLLCESFSRAPILKHSDLLQCVTKAKIEGTACLYGRQCFQRDAKILDQGDGDGPIVVIDEELEHAPEQIDSGYSGEAWNDVVKVEGEGMSDVGIFVCAEIFSDTSECDGILAPQGGTDAREMMCTFDSD